MANTAGIDGNMRRALSALSSANDGAIVNLWADPTTHRLLVDNAGSGGGITVGTTTITGGTDKGILYDNAGVVGEYTPSASLILGTDASKNVVSLSTATYPSLTELSYVKGVTSAIQTQINAKGAGTVTAIGVTTANGVSGSSSGGATPNLTITLGAITPTTVNGNTFTTGTGTLTLGAGKTTTFDHTSTFTTTDSQTYTFPTTSATIARTDATQTFTGLQTYSNAVNYTNNAITASGNAATVPITARLSTVTNNSAAGLTITITTTSAVDGQIIIVRSLPSSNVAQTITWVNTENSDVTPSANLNASTTSPRTDGFMFNSGTSKWRCVASA